MAIILNLETSTKNCSVSVASNGKQVSLVEKASEHYSHGEQLHLFIEEAIRLAHIELQELDAVCVSKGPGSYTGLRIGVSAAKGLCFSLNKPLISIGSLEVLARGSHKDSHTIIPILDARRMEVYSAIFNSSFTLLRDIKAEIIDENSFSTYLNENPSVLIGDAVDKCKTVLDHNNFEFIFQYPSAKDMCEISFDKYKKSDFEDVAYFEPYYLKDFVATPQKKML